MPYFHISHGRRGCYMPDDAYVIRANTRRELRAALESEAHIYRDAGYVGANQRAISHIAALAWRDRKKTAQLPYCLPLAPAHARDTYAYGVFVSAATRAEYLEWRAEIDE